MNEDLYLTAGYHRYMRNQPIKLKAAWIKHLEKCAYPKPSDDEKPLSVKEMKAYLKSFRFARRVLTKSNAIYICHSLPLSPYAREIAEFIENRLQGEAVFTSWFHANNFDVYAYPEFLTVHARIQWLTLLIEEFKKRIEEAK